MEPYIEALRVWKTKLSSEEQGASRHLFLIGPASAYFSIVGPEQGGRSSC
jgi:hypothetical protein